MFVYNGLGRVGPASPLQILTGQGVSLVCTAGPPGVGRLLTGGLGQDIGWLLTPALLAAAAGVISARGRPRVDPLRAGYLLWGVWLVVGGRPPRARCSGTNLPSHRCWIS